MRRDFLFAYFQNPRGEVLRRRESDFIQRSITVSCKQTILQIGALGWESDLIDSSLYKYYYILDADFPENPRAGRIVADSCRLPLQCNSVDMILMPHFLEFDPHCLQTMREVERVLKPEGIVVVLNFNPWSFRIRYQYAWHKQKKDRWIGSFISRNRVNDWLRLLNFEIIMLAEFNAKLVRSIHGKFIDNYFSLTADAYAIKAIKRRYNIIPLTPAYEARPRLVLTNPINSSTRIGS